MTLKEFYEELTKLDMDVILEEDLIRLWDKDKELQYCPITAVYTNKFHKYFSIVAWIEAANRLHLDYKVAVQIVAASDSRNLANEAIRNIKNELLWRLTHAIRS